MSAPLSDDAFLAFWKERNIVPQFEAPLHWRKSTKCASAACVEVAERPNAMFVRDSKSPVESVLAFTHVDWNTFVAGIKEDTLESR